MAGSCSFSTCTNDAEIRDYCKTCYHRLYRSEVRRPRMMARLGDSCFACGSKDNLHFDHIDPALKACEIDDHLASTAKALAEIEKCQLLCRSCHEAKTARENSGFTHGTTYAWMKMRCDCASCADARSAYNAARRQSRRLAMGGRGEYRRPSTHGEQLHYRRGCRCTECRAANTAYARQLQATRF